MFRADGQTDCIGLDALIQQFFRAQLAVGGGSRMDHQALHICHIGKQREYLQAVDKLVSFLHTTLDLKGKDRAAATREIFFIQGVVGMVGQAGVIDLFHQRMGSQEFNDLFCVLCVAFQAQGQGFRALQQQECRKGRNTGTGIPQQHRPDIGDKGSSAYGFYKGNTVIAGVGVSNGRVLP